VVSIEQYPALGFSAREYEVNLKPGAHNYYRLSVVQGGSVMFQRTAEDAAP
jgi:hypothetical protein